MMIDILVFIIGVVLISIMAYGCWISSVILSHRSQLRRITGAYYDFEIDEVLEEWGMTREEALKKFSHIYD